jgi:hypothetical protein
VAGRGVIGVLGVLTLVGLVGLVWLALGGAEPRGQWGYVAATAVFVLSACQVAPAVAFTTRLGRGYWGAPLRRVADSFGLAGLVSAPVLILVLRQLPEWHERPSIWFDWPGAPFAWDTLALIGLALTGIALAWLGTWPDRARTGSRGWIGTQRQWRVLTRGLTVLGALYCLLLGFVHLLIASDLALSLVPGWHSAVIPAYQIVSSYEAAVALAVVGLAVINRLAPEAADGPDAFQPCAKLLLALGLLWFYFVWCEFLTYWYGRTPDEQSLLALLMFGPGAGLFLVSALGHFLLPLLVLLWHKARTSRRVTTAVAVAVLVGSFVDRLRVYVGAWSVATPLPEEHLPDSLPPLPLPGPPEVAACVGILAAVGLVIVLALRRSGPVARWEVDAVERLMPERRLLRTRVPVVARPS